MERRVRVDHLAQPLHGNTRVHGKREHAQYLAADRADRSSADEDPAAGVLHELDEPLVAGLVDPAPSRRGNLARAGPRVQALVASLRLGQADRADLGIGEPPAPHRASLRPLLLLAQYLPAPDPRG